MISVDVQDCRKIVSTIKNGQSFDVIDFRVVRVSNQDRLEIEVKCKNDGAQTFNFLIKNAAADEIAAKECQFYGTFVKSDFAPKCYHANDAALIMENLSDHAKRRDPFDKSHVEIALRTLAKLHATGFARSEGEFARKYDDIKDLQLVQCARRKLNRVQFKEKLLDDLQKIEDNWNRNRYKKVLCHGDLRPTNIFFDYDDDGALTDCKLANYERMRWAPPAHDVTYLIYHATTEETRRSNYHGFLNYYYTELEKELLRRSLKIAQEFPHDEYDESCRRFVKIAKYLKLVVNDGHANAQTLSDVEELINSEAITREDCYQIMEGIGTKDFTFVARPIEDVSGFIGDTHKLTITADKTYHCFVKIVSSRQVVQDYVKESGVIEKELDFYRRLLPSLTHVFPALADCIAKCYACNRTMMAFDDLIADGYRILDKRVSLDYEHVMRFLDSLAKFHASAWALEEKRSRKLKRTYTLTEEYRMAEAFYRDGDETEDLSVACKNGFLALIDYFKDRSRPDFDDETFRRRGLKYLTLKNYVRPSRKYRNVLCHGDLWTSNLMFNASNCKIIDHQSYRYAPPANDLMASLYLTTDRKFRDRHLDKLVAFYYGKLAENLRSVAVDVERFLTPAEFRESCEYERRFAIAQAVSHSQLMYMTSDQMRDLFDDDDACKEAMIQNRGVVAIKLCETDAFCREILLERMIEFKEFCANDYDVIF